MTKERTSELEDMSRETYKTEKQLKKMTEKNPKQNIQELWNDYKRCDIWVMGIPEGEEKEKHKNLSEAKTENFPQIMSDSKIQTWEAQMDKCQKLHLRILFSHYEKSKKKKYLEKKDRHLAIFSISNMMF